jgi:glycosyltransferase involved in cell wall biosynthesis
MLFERRNTACAAAVLYTTEEERRRAGDFARQPGVVVPLGIDVPAPANGDPREEMLRRWPELSGKKVVLFLGRLHPKKGLDLLVRAFAAIARRRADAVLVLAGPDDGIVRELGEWLRAERIESRVLLTGMLRGEDKAAMLRGADVFVLASYAENFAIAVAEAMAESRPVVISDQVYIWREVAAAEAGLVVRCDAGELESALDKLLADGALADRMGRNGRRLVEERFRWDEIADRVIDLYRRAAEGTTRQLVAASSLNASIGSTV